MEKEPLRLAVSDWWPGFELQESFLWQALTSRWRVELDDDADILVYGPYTRGHARSRATKVLCLGEPIALPTRLGHDYSLSWHRRDDDDRHVRVAQGIWRLLTYPSDVDMFASRSFEDWVERPYFCNFVYSNAVPPERREFFAALSRRRFVHSPGAVERNTDPLPGGREIYGWWWQKIAYHRQFRFTIAFENRTLPGYTSEKVVDALLAGTIPIYWGNPEIALDVDPGSIVDANDFDSWDDLAEFIVYLDDHRELARPLLEHPRPLLLDLDETRDAIVALFERVEAGQGLAAGIRRAVRPVLYDVARARGQAARRARRTRAR